MSDLTSGSITKSIIINSWAVMLSMFLQTLFNIVDTAFVGRISAEAIAAVSFEFPVVFMMVSFMTGLGVGATSLIARAIGAKKYSKADEVAMQSLLMGLIFSIIYTFIGLVFGKHIFLFMGAGSLLPLVLEYTNVIFMGSIFSIITIIGSCILRGEGNMNVPMYSMGASAVLNIILDPIFIFVLGLGVRGAAIATVLARSVSFFVILFYLFKDKAIVRLKYIGFKFKSGIIKTILKMGLPVSSAQILLGLSIFLLTKIVSKFGVRAIAAYGIGFKLDSVAMLPIMGLMMAIVTLVGHNVGARKLYRARKIAFVAMTLGMLFSAFIGLLFFFFPRLFISIFNKDWDVLRLTLSYLEIVPWSYAFVAMGAVMLGAFLGAGKPYVAFVLNLLRTLVLVVPLAFILSLYFGLMGVWYGITLGLILSGLISFIWFKASIL